MLLPAAVVAIAAAFAACQTASNSSSRQPAESSVSPQVLAPAPDPPLVALCTTPIQSSADGRARPLFCRNGAINVLAWRFYAPTSDTLFRMGRTATQPYAEAAMCDDFDHNHSTRAEEADAFRLAAAYYGWNFIIDTVSDPCI